MVVGFLGGLFAGDFDLVGIYHHHVVAAVKVRGKVGLGFTHEKLGDFGGKAAQDLAFGVEKMPGSGNVFWFGGVSLH